MLHTAFLYCLTCWSPQRCRRYPRARTVVAKLDSPSASHRRQAVKTCWGNHRDNLRTIGVCVCEREPVKSSIPKNNDRTKKNRSIAGLYILSSWHKWESCHGKECLIGFCCKASLLAAAWNNRKQRPLGKLLDLTELVSILTKCDGINRCFSNFSHCCSHFILWPRTHVCLYTYTL